MKAYSISDITDFLKEDHFIINKSAYQFDNAKPVTSANESSLVWISPNNKNKIETALATKAKIIIADFSFKDVQNKITSGKSIITVRDPRLTYIRLVNHFFAEKISWAVHKSATIHEEAKIHAESYIGPNSYIGKSVVGKGTVIHGNCFIYDNVQIGENVIIHAGTVIGAEGFGYERNENKEFEKFPHLGGVIIENNVDIGANTCIDRGTLGDTIIKEGAKIDNLVHIAHNVVIGKHAAVIAHAMIGGSTVIGDYAWIAPNAGLREGISIGNNSTVGLGAVVTKTIPENEVWAGNPAKLFQK